MLSDINNLTRLNKTQIKLAADVLARAFQDDPLFSYFLPNSVEREKNLPHLFNMAIRYAVMRGEVYASSKFEGIAVWLPSEKAEMSPWQMIMSGGLSLMLKMGMRSMARMMRYMDYAAAVHKLQVPLKHWYLELIGVDPEFQGKGYASALLKPMFNRFDAEGLPCYLESFTRVDVSIYQHFGFEVAEEGTIPGTKTTFWAMLRQ